MNEEERNVYLQEKNKKFTKKNLDNYKKLNQRIDELGKNLLVMVASVEMFEWLKLSDDVDEIFLPDDNMIFYKNKTVLKHIYLAASSIVFVTKDAEKIEFLVPCLGGCYPDEPHVH